MTYDLCDSEYRFASMIWDHAPINSTELVKLANKELGWKKSTTYTVLKKLCDKGILANEQAVVTTLVKREEVQKYESEQFIERTFGGSLPSFLASFMSDKRITKSEAEQLQRLIDTYKED